MDASSSQSVSDTDSIFPEIDSTRSFLDSTSSLPGFVDTGHASGGSRGGGGWGGVAIVMISLFDAQL